MSCGILFQFSPVLRTGTIWTLGFPSIWSVCYWFSIMDFTRLIRLSSPILGTLRTEGDRNLYRYFSWSFAWARELLRANTSENAVSSYCEPTGDRMGLASAVDVSRLIIWSDHWSKFLGLVFGGLVKRFLLNFGDVAKAEGKCMVPSWLWGEIILSTAVGIFRPVYSA